MNRFVTSIAVAILLAAPAVVPSSAMAQSVGEKTGVNVALGISQTTQDFVKEAADSDILELAAAQVAWQKGNEDEKKFAEQMITGAHHCLEVLAALGVVGDVKAEIPTVLDAASQKKLDRLRDARPDDFASEYDPMQVSAHKDAVSLFDRYSKSGEAKGLGRQDVTGDPAPLGNGAVA